MERIAFHLKIEEGQREAYRKEHENVPKWLEEAYVDSDAGLETYSVFEMDGHVFGYMELEDPATIKDVMENSDAQKRWAERMEPIVTDEGSIWMDEVYRMV